MYGGSDGKGSACKAGDPGSTPLLGRSPQEGRGNPLQYSCLENPMDRGAWWATVHGVEESWARLSNQTLCMEREGAGASLPQGGGWCGPWWVVEPSQAGTSQQGCQNVPQFSEFMAGERTKQFCNVLL